MMDLLKREAAPITPEAWELIDEEARRVLKVKLAGRKLVDVKGPHGWKYPAVNLGALDLLQAHPAEHVSAGVRKVQPLVELRTPFQLELMELDTIARGSDTPDLEPVSAAAARIAMVEDRSIFKGYAEASISGLTELSPHTSIEFGHDPHTHLASVVHARQKLWEAGIGGPYGLVLGPRQYVGLLEATDDGLPVIDRVRSVLGGPIVESHCLQGGVLLSVRGGDFELTLGHDYSIGFVTADRDKAELYLTVSFTFRVLEPAAALQLTAS